MQGKGHRSKSPAGDSRLPTLGMLPRLHLPSFADAAAVQTGSAQEGGLLRRPLYDAPRSAPQKAARSRDSSAQQAAPSPLLMTDPGDLIARALAILAEEEEACQARRGFDLASRSVR